jgi:signal transduction histidine kinase
LENNLQDINSINKLLQGILNPVEKIESLNHYAEKIRASNINQSLSYSEQALSLAESNNYQKGLAYAYWNRGIAHRLLAKYDEAFTDMDKAFQIYTKLDDKKGLSRILNSKGNIYLSLSEYEQALYYLNKSLEISDASDDFLQKAIILSNIGLIHQETGDYPKALENYLKSMQIYSEHSDKIPFSLYNNIGIVYQNISDYATALEYYFRSLETCEQENNQMDKAYTLGNIAITYGELGEFDNSIKYFRDSLQIITSLGYKQAETNGLNNLADAYKKAGSFDKALRLLNQSMIISDEIGDKSSRAFSLNLTGEIYMLIGDFEVSKKYFLESLELSKNINDSLNKILAYILLGKLYKETGDNDASLMSFINAQQCAEQKNSLNELIEIHREISDIYSLMKKPEKALEHYKLHHKYESRQFDSNIDKRLKTIFIQNQIKTKDKDYLIALREKELYRLKNVELASLNDRLHFLNNEIKEFLGIAIHDLKNPLSGIKVYSHKLYNNLEKYSVEEIKEMAFEMEQASNRMFDLIAKLLDINKIETGSRNYNYINLELAEVVRVTIDDFREQALIKNINIIFNSDLKSEVYADLLSLRQIITNLISNALKFSPFNKSVYLSLKEDRENIELHIKDEGPGLTETDKLKLFKKFPRMSTKPTNNELSTGLGLYIVDKLVKANNGRIWCESREGCGADFVIEFPKVENLKIPFAELTTSNS